MATLDAAPASNLVDNARFGSFQFGITALCAIIALLDGFDTQAIAYVAPSIAEAWDLQTSAFGPIFSAGLLGLTIGAFVISPLSDRFGRKPMLLMSTGIFGLFALLTATAGSIDELLIYRLLTGIGLGGAMPNIIALTNEYAPTHLKATLVTIMFCGFPLGSTLGGLASAPLIANFGWEAVFVVGGAMPLLLMPVLVVALPESVRFLALRGGSERRIATILSKLDATASSADFARSIREQSANAKEKDSFPVLRLFAEGRARVTALLWLAFFMNLLVMYFLVNWMPSLLRELGLPLGIAILSTAILNLGGVIGAIALGRLIDNRDPYVVLGSAYAASALFIAVVAFAGSNLWILLTGAFLAGFGVVGAQIGVNAVAAAIYPTSMRSTGVGWALGIGRIGSIIGPLAGGILLGMGWSVQSIILTAVVPALIASGAIYALRARKE